MLLIIQAIAQNEFIVYHKSCIVRFHRDHPGMGLIQECEDLEGRRISNNQQILQVLQSSPRIHDVLHDQHMLVFNGIVQIFHDLDNASGNLLIPIA